MWWLRLVSKTIKAWDRNQWCHSRAVKHSNYRTIDKISPSWRLSKSREVRACIHRGPSLQEPLVKIVTIDYSRTVRGLISLVLLEIREALLAWGYWLAMMWATRRLWRSKKSFKSAIKRKQKRSSNWSYNWLRLSSNSRRSKRTMMIRQRFLKDLNRCKKSMIEIGWSLQLLINPELTKKTSTRQRSTIIKTIW